MVENKPKLASILYPEKVYKGRWRKPKDFADAIKWVLKHNRLLAWHQTEIASKTNGLPQFCTLYNGGILFIAPKFVSSDIHRYLETKQIKWHLYIDEYHKFCNLAKSINANVLVIVAIDNGPKVYAGTLLSNDNGPVVSIDLGKFDNLAKVFEVLD